MGENVVLFALEFKYDRGHGTTDALKSDPGSVQTKESRLRTQTRIALTSDIRPRQLSCRSKLLCQRSVLANRVDKIRKSRLSFSHSFANAVFYDPAFQIIRLPCWWFDHSHHRISE